MGFYEKVLIALISSVLFMKIGGRPMSTPLIEVYNSPKCKYINMPLYLEY